MLVTLDKWVKVLSIECIKMIDIYRFARKQCVLHHKITQISCVNLPLSSLTLSYDSHGFDTSFCVSHYALLGVRGLKQMIKLFDQNDWNDTDAEQGTDNSSAAVSITSHFFYSPCYCWIQTNIRLLSMLCLLDMTCNDEQNYHYNETQVFRPKYQ